MFNHIGILMVMTIASIGLAGAGTAKTSLLQKSYAAIILRIGYKTVRKLPLSFNAVVIKLIQTI